MHACMLCGQWPKVMNILSRVVFFFIATHWNHWLPMGVSTATVTSPVVPSQT